MTTWVLLRGLARDARHWNGFDAQLRRALPVGDDVVALDLPGNGRRCGEPSPLTVTGMVDAARSELARTQHRAPYVLVALSLGGMVALQWAADHPQELAGCVLVNSSVRGAAWPWQRLRPRALATLLATLSPLVPARVRERRIIALTTNLRADAPELAGRWAAWARQSGVSRANAWRQFAAALRFRAPAAWPGVPALVLASLRDRVVAPACSIAIARRVGAQLRLHPQAGHDLPLDAPEWMIAQITAWWSLRAGA